MSLAAEPRKLTAEEFAALPDDGRRLELVEGEVVEMAPAGFEHSGVSFRVMARVESWASPGRLGRAFGSDLGCIVRRNPDTVREPDGAFYVAGRAPQVLPQGYAEVIPDLILEVGSPNDRPGQVYAKVMEWLDAGVKVVWLVWPRTRRVTIFHGPDDLEVLAEGDVLTDPLLPGFALPVVEIFA